MGMKRCSKCGESKSLTEDFWYWRKDSKNWRPYCKNCFQKQRHQYPMVCINCGKQFNGTLSQFKKGDNVFCSHKCRTKDFISENALTKMSKSWIKKGEHLGETTQFKKGEAPHNPYPKGHIPWNYTGTTIICATCGVEIQRKPYHAGKNAKNYCSRKCSYAGLYKGGKEGMQKRNRVKTRNLDDSYIVQLLIFRGFNRQDISKEAIIFQRQKIKMYRALKQFKQWRDENEPSNSDVQGKQHEDEADHEGRVPN